VPLPFLTPATPFNGVPGRLAHDGQGASAREAFQRLSTGEQEALIAFVRSL